MGLNVSTSMGFENRDSLKNTAKEILLKNGASKGTKSIDETIFGVSRISENSQLSILKASSQISMNSSLNETLKYLKSHAYIKTTKKPVLGELWAVFTSNTSNESDYQGELYDFEISEDAQNIFAA